MERRWAGAGTCGVKGGTNVGLHASLESCLRRAKEKKKKHTSEEPRKHEKHLRVA